MYNRHHNHFGIELQAASGISQAQDQALRDHSPNTRIAWLASHQQIHIFLLGFQALFSGFWLFNKCTRPGK